MSAEPTREVDLTRAWPLVVTGGPWPERVGLRARLVPPSRRQYPWAGLPLHEVVVLIKNDPLNARTEWTCVLGRHHLSAASPKEPT